jgi:hypothetical protein
MNDEEKAVDGCGIIDEFIGQGAATGGRQPFDPQPLLPSLSSTGCVDVIHFSDLGFVPSSEAKKEAEPEQDWGRS